MEYPKPNLCEWTKVQVISRAGKATGKYRNHFNIRNSVNNSISCVDWDKATHRWKYVENNEEVLTGEHMTDDCDVLDAKLKSLENGKQIKFMNQSHLLARNVYPPDGY